MSEDNVVRLNVITRLPLDPKIVLSGAGLTDWDQILIIGWDKDGEFSVRSSTTSTGDILLMLELAKHRLSEAAGW